MKAKDLAALAALGMGGAYLYNRNKKSDDEAPAASPKSRDFDAVEPEDQMPAYQGRTADRLADIQNEYGGSTNAATKGDKRSDADDFKSMRMPTRPGQKTSGMVKRPVTTTAAAPFSSGRKPSVSQATLNSAKSQEIIDRMAKRTRPYLTDEVGNNLKRGGAVKKMASGGSVSSASSRGDGIAQKGKTRGKMC